jgi:hypothetical protein
MAKKHYRPILERLEQRQLLTANVWFADSGQHLGANTDGAELADLDGDGDLDLFAGCKNWPSGPSCNESQVWLNNGSGQFSKGWSGGTSVMNDVAMGDLDNDGDLDAYVAKGNPFGVQPSSEVWFNDGKGNFEDSGQRLNDFARDVELGDLDGDGDLDAVTANLNRLPSKVWLNDGSGQFTNSGQRIPDGFRFALGDLDGDGDLDAWFGRGTSDSVSYIDRVYLNDGAGEFTDSGQSLNTASTGDVKLGDLDGDGDLDAYLANGNLFGSSIPDQVWLNDGKGTFTDSGQRLGKSIGNAVELGDLDDDGDLDAIVANGVNDRSSWFKAVVEQPNAVWLNNGKGVFTHSGQEIGNAWTWNVRLGDLDNDGDLDAFFANVDQDNEIWFNTQSIAGDANRDGVFNSSDLIVVFQAGEYEDGIAGNSTWAEGDWSGDGDFDTADLILAFQLGKYVAAAVPGSVFETIAPQRESLIVKRRGLFTDVHDGSLNANAIDQVFEQVLL